MPKHADETSKQAKEIFPKDIPKTFSETTTAGGLARNQQLQVAKEAWDRQEEKSVTWDELDGERQRSYYDVSVDIYARGGGTNSFELKVQEVKAEVGAGTFVLQEPGPYEPEPPPILDVLMTDEEKEELVKKAEADRKIKLSDDDKRQLIEYEQRRRNQERNRFKLKPEPVVEKNRHTIKP